MRSGSAHRGDVVQFEHPEWRPLTALLGASLTGQFMWMHEVRLADGTAVHAYKHTRTRRYLHLDADRRAYAYLGGVYRRIEPSLAVVRIVLQCEQPVRPTEAAPR